MIQTFAKIATATKSSFPYKTMNYQLYVKNYSIWQTKSTLVSLFFFFSLVFFVCFIFLSFLVIAETGGNDPSHFALRFVRTKDGELTYQCGLCGYLPNSTNKSVGYAKSRVCMHIKNVHSEPTNVVCPRCAKKFKNKESLRVHRIKYCRDLNATGGGSD